ncbi:MAG: hypothetical protein WCY58_13075 [Mariniphaga sp.]|nr:hypothetical protein [Mariniphaga sp.]MDD4425570.1 hypothetical protein [Mariniphaga sp.]
MHIVPILWMLTWPALIAVSFFAVWWMVKKFEAKLENKENKN